MTAISYDDIFIPECAALVLEELAQYDEKTLQLAIICMAYCVEATLSRN